MTEHTILVGIVIEADTREQAHEALLDVLPTPTQMVQWKDDPNWPGARDRVRPVDSWWVAEDDRMDNSDNDSAVFVHRGRQYDASLALARLGYTPETNVKGTPDGERWIATTTVYDPKTGRDLPTVSLDNPGVTHDKNEARNLRNSYILAISGAGAVGAPARVYGSPTDREAWVVEYRSMTTDEVTMRETVTMTKVEG